ncbi:MAG TPA: glycosyltransferase family A protein [Polyangia bacterium]|nr:glycosyltransferase family A protein [Polyangia bacterium]
MNVALVVVTDGRAEYLPRAVNSLAQQLRPYPEFRYVMDDSGDANYGAFLREAWGGEFAVRSHFEREGFVATVADAWRLAIQEPSVEYVFHAEDDFTYNEPVDLGRMVAILDENPHLAQLVLKRQPVNGPESHAGDITRMDPDAWVVHPTFTEYTRNFSTNPCLIPRRVIQLVLRERVATAEMALTWFLQEHGYTFGYVGDIDDPPRVQHIGEHRAEGARYP